MPDQIRRHGNTEFFMIQNELIDKGVEVLGLSAGAMMVYIALLRYSSFETNTAFPGQTTIGKKIAMTRQTVNKYIQEVERCGLIRVKEQRDRKGYQISNLYLVMDAKQVIAEKVALAQSSEVPEVPGAKLINIGGVDYIDDREVNDSKPEGAPTGPENEEQARADRFTWQPGDAEITPPQQDKNDREKPTMSKVSRPKSNILTPAVKNFDTKKTYIKKIKDPSLIENNRARAKEKSAAFIVTPVVDHELNKKQIKKLRDLVSAKDGGKGRKTEIHPGPVNTRIHPDPVEEVFPLENSKQGGDYP